MRIGVPREHPDQPLVAATPTSVKALRQLGYEVTVESGAGERASFPDAHYQDAGAELGDAATVWSADIVISLDAPTAAQLASMRTGATLLARLAPARHPELVAELSAAELTALAVDAVPRISRAQSMDVLSSQANIVGYRAVIEAAAHFGRVFTGQITAAGKLPPARVYVIGAGVAGLAAIGTASSLGAEVSASDVRPEVAEQVQSLGAKFVPLPTATSQSTDGYARALADEQAAAAAALYAAQAAAHDIVITTANIPGRRAPVLLDEAAVAAMAPGSVIVDLAAANGGNCTLTVPDEVVTTPGGVQIVGYRDLAARLPAQASHLYGSNLVNLLRLLTPGRDGQLQLDLTDEIVRGITVTDRGQVLWPPPPVTVSATPAPAGPPTPTAATDSTAPDRASQARARRGRLCGLFAAGLALAALIFVSPAQVTGHYVTLLLSVTLGFYVISNVTPALHTPLMSVTNAISGIVLVGGIAQIGHPHPAVAALSFAAITLASVNIFGGFAVTHRMLAMFRKD
ncbi:Re/Si-specific NAD(P)(+) transhydrogenase subunit alpha [Buchananella hordeovulneris]|uniref:proton-translocating NAD(P)(+) transhydrogenase n=1 Tax=Buchananella hordeovulneris TaxID=52770 RepID=A0A1Q5PYR8_9ACTO|nr:Re/Si-specific NAD(P)(+) transhydrogenase subunit alpha [Buchananella hordeovulneris]OKL52771.1 NAD(P) transhydrogenase subunit alpha [Buchananella hordeovulneris]